MPALGESPTTELITNLTKPTEQIIQQEYELTMCTIYVPNKGYLCKIEQPKETGAPTMIVPVQSFHSYEMPPGKNPQDVSADLVADELEQQLTDKKHLISMLRTHKDVSLKVHQANDALVTGVNVYDVICEDTKLITDLERSGKFVFVPENMLILNTVKTPEPAIENLPLLTETEGIGTATELKKFIQINETATPILQTLTIAGKQQQVFIHPDCQFLYNERTKPYEITGNESFGFLKNLAHEVVARLESIEGNLEKTQDRLTLKHIESIQKVVTDKKLAEDLETAYLSERMVAIAFQHIGTAVSEAGIVSLVANRQDLLSVLALGGALANGLAIESLAGKAPGTKVSFGDLLNDALLDIGRNHPSLSKSGITGMDNFVGISPSIARRLSDADAMKSLLADKYLPLATNTLVAAASAPWEIAAVYGAVSFGTTMFESVYREKLKPSHERKDDNSSEANKKHESVIKNVTKKFLAPAIRASGKYAPAIITRIPFSSAQGLEVAISLASFYAAHDVTRLSKTESSIKREKTLHQLEQILDWVENDAFELNTNAQYDRYCQIKVRQLTRQTPTQLTLPDRAILGEQINRSIKHNPREIQLTAKVIDKGQTTDQTIRYPILDRVFGQSTETEESRDIRRKHELELRQNYSEDTKTDFIDSLTYLRRNIARNTNRGAVFCDFTIDFPGEKVLLRNASFVAPVGKIIVMEGEINSQILQSLAERRRSVQGTTYIRTKKNDINVHIDETRSELLYCDCKTEENDEFFSGKDPQKTLEFIQNSNLFTKEEVIRLERMVTTGQPIKRFSRGSGTKLAIAQSFFGKESVVILDHTFGTDLSYKDEEMVTTFLDTMSNEKAIIIRADPSRQYFNRTLGRKGKLTHYEVANRLLKQAEPDIDTMTYTLEQAGVGSKWSEQRRRRLAKELLSHSKLEFENGEPIRKLTVTRADIYTEAPDGTIYKLVQVKKIEPTSSGGTKVIDQLDQEHSVYRSVEDNDAAQTLRFRLGEMGIDLDTVEHTDFVHTPNAERKESASFPDLDTDYSYMDTKITVPYEFMQRNPTELYAYHRSGGFTQFRWEKVTTNSQEESQN